MDKELNEAVDNIYQLALKHFGPEKQIIKAIAECGELSQALTRFMLQTGRSEEVIEKLVDIQITLNQLALHFGEENFDKIFALKMYKLGLKIHHDIMAQRGITQDITANS